LRKRYTIAVLSAALLAAGLAPVAYDPYEKAKCIPIDGSPFSTGQTGYEFVDLGRRIVWGTSDWSLTKFAAFELPWHKPFYVKNDPRRGYADSAKITRSPGCNANGEYNTLQAFGREFRQVVRLISHKRVGTAEAQLLYTTLEKYHRLLYRSGRSVSVLHAPDGDQYIAVSRTVLRLTDANPLPDGWRIETYELTEDFDLDLSGTVVNIRTPNKDSFQGPLDTGSRFPR